MRTPPTPASHHRFHLLDALRGLVAVFVVLVHAPAYLQTRIPIHNAFLGVDFFFCLSGFVIAFSYERRLLGDLSLGSFMRARLIRLYPVYLAGSLLGAILLLTVDAHLPGTFTLPHKLRCFALAMALLPNLDPRISALMFPLDLPAWSLFFEVVANLVFGLVVRARLSSTWPYLATAALSALFLGRSLASGRLLGEIGWNSSAALLPLGLARVALSFAMGMVVLQLYRARPHPLWLKPLKPALPLAVTAFLVLLLVAPARSMQTGSFQLLCLALLFPAVVLLGAYSHLAPALDAVAVVLGDISYPLYMVHLFFLRPLGFRHVVVFAQKHPAAAVLLLPADILLAAIASWFLARRYDAPIRRALNRRSAVRSRVSPVAA